MIGVRSELKAAWHAWRVFNRLQFQNTAVEFEGMEEAALTVVRDRILIADLTRPGIQDGEVIQASGAQIRTSQKLDATGGPFTIFLQHTDATIESLPVVSVGERSVVMGAAPSLPLVTDDAAGQRTRYILVRNSQSEPRAYMLTEKAFKQEGIFQMTAVNYSSAYYFYEGLRLWLQPKILLSQAGLDSSPYKVVVTNTSIGTTNDATRGLVYVGNAITDNLLASTPTYSSYSKTGWFLKTNSGVETLEIICSPASTQEQFLIHSSDNLLGIHGGVTYVAASYAGHIGVWTHVGLTFDALNLVMRLYIDGEMVDSATSVPGPGLVANRTVFGGMVGRGDEVRLFNRALSQEAMREVYQKSRMV